MLSNKIIRLFQIVGMNNSSHWNANNYVKT